MITKRAPGRSAWTREVDRKMTRFARASAVWFVALAAALAGGATFLAHSGLAKEEQTEAWFYAAALLPALSAWWPRGRELRARWKRDVARAAAAAVLTAAAYYAFVDYQNHPWGAGP